MQLDGKQALSLFAFELYEKTQRCHAFEEPECLKTSKVLKVRRPSLCTRIHEEDDAVCPMLVFWSIELVVSARLSGTATTHCP